MGTADQYEVQVGALKTTMTDAQMWEKPNVQVVENDPAEPGIK